MNLEQITERSFFGKIKNGLSRGSSFLGRKLIFSCLVGTLWLGCGDSLTKKNFDKEVDDEITQIMFGSSDIGLHDTSASKPDVVQAESKSTENKKLSDYLCWEKTIENNSLNVLFSVEALNNGEFVASGYTGFPVDGKFFSKGLVLRFDQKGKTIQINYYSPKENSLNRLRSISQITNGNLVAVGDNYKQEESKYGNAWILELDPSGGLVWSKIISSEKGHCSLNSTQGTSDGGFVSAGFTTANTNNSAWVLKFDQNKIMEWQKLVNPDGLGNAYSVQQINDGYILAGLYDPPLMHIGSCLLAKLDLKGNLEWMKLVGGKNCAILYSISKTADGGYIGSGQFAVTGSSISGNKNFYDASLIRLDGVGSLEWIKVIEEKGEEDSLFSVKQTKDKGFIAAGNINLLDESKSVDALVIKLDTMGNIEWKGTLGGSGSDEARFITENGFGEYIVVGITQSKEIGVYGWIFKLNSDGKTYCE
jgi:hypothetical protein